MKLNSKNVRSSLIIVGLLVLFIGISNLLNLPTAAFVPLGPPLFGIVPLGLPFSAVGAVVMIIPIKK